MAKVYVFVNQKGGVGKTTSVINIGAYMAAAGKKVLLVDFDSQGNMSSGVGISKEKPTIYELMAGLSTYEKTVRRTEVINLDAVAASIDLSGAAIELVDQSDREFYLKKALENLKNEYDYILIDCPPSLGILTLNGLAAADAVLVPMQCEYFALEGISKLLNTIKIIKSKLNPKLEIEGFLLTMYDSRLRLARQIYDEVKRHFQELVFKTVIQRNVKLSESPSHGLPVILYDADSTGAKNHLALAKEIIEKNKK